jgi:hypothetical protein
VIDQIEQDGFDCVIIAITAGLQRVEAGGERLAGLLQLSSSTSNNNLAITRDDFISRGAVKGAGWAVCRGNEGEAGV